jgi:hypothetical protein
MTTHLLRSLLLAALFFIAVGAHSAWAQPLFPLKFPVLQASSSALTSSGQAKKPKKEKKAKGKKGGGVTFYEGSGETRGERERRLMRECKGRPNSGVCEGYTR